MSKNSLFNEVTPRKFAVGLVSHSLQPYSDVHLKQYQIASVIKDTGNKVVYETRDGKTHEMNAVPEQRLQLEGTNVRQTLLTTQRLVFIGSEPEKEPKTYCQHCR